VIDITSVLFHQLTIGNILRPSFGLAHDR